MAWGDITGTATAWDDAYKAPVDVYLKDQNGNYMTDQDGELIVIQHVDTTGSHP
jgi:hypothetical protein